ncbi:MAG: hypothetical protein AB7S26_19680 [Sandaracinaceae bacterium]
MGGFTSVNAKWPPVVPIALVLALLAACGGPEPCATRADCPAPTVCGLAGRCARLREPTGARFARSRWVLARDHGVTGAPTLTDRLAVGDGHEALLAFGPLPGASRILRALLVLHPHDAAERGDAERSLFVERTGPFVGGGLPRRGGHAPDRFAAAARRVAPGPPRTLRFDVTHAAREAGEGELYLIVRTDDAALTFASPYHRDPRARPRLELLLH